MLGNHSDDQTIRSTCLNFVKVGRFFRPGEAVRNEPELTESVEAKEGDHLRYVFVDDVTSALRLGFTESMRTVVNLKRGVDCSAVGQWSLESQDHL